MFHIPTKIVFWSAIIRQHHLLFISWNKVKNLHNFHKTLPKCANHNALFIIIYIKSNNTLINASFLSWCYIKLNVHDWSSILSTSLCPQGHLLHVFQTQPFNYTRVWFIQHFDQESRVGFVMFGKFSVHAWGQCGGLNEEHFIVVHWGPRSCFTPLVKLKWVWPSMNWYKKLFKPPH